MKTPGNDQSPQIKQTSSLEQQTPSRRKGLSKMVGTVANLFHNSKFVSKKILPSAAATGDTKQIQTILSKYEIKNEKLWPHAGTALRKGHEEAFKVLYEKAGGTEADKAVFIKDFLTSQRLEKASLPALISVAGQDASLRRALINVFVENFGEPGHEEITATLSEHSQELFTKGDGSAYHLWQAANSENEALAKVLLGSPDFFEQGRIANEKTFNKLVTVRDNSIGYQDEVKRPDQQAIEFLQNIFLDMLKKDEIPYTDKLPALLDAELNQNTDFARDLKVQIDAALIREKFDTLLQEGNLFARLPIDAQFKIISDHFPNAFTSADMSETERTNKILEILNRQSF